MSEPAVSYERWVEFLRARAKEISESRHQQMIECFIEHMISERSGDIDRFMRTMVAEPVYRSWGRLRPAGTPPSVRRRADIRELYRRMMERPDGFPQFELRTERFWVGDDGLAMDGVLHRLARGFELAELGEQLPDGAFPDDEFVVSRRMALFISFEDGLMRGEDCYYDSASTVASARAD